MTRPVAMALVHHPVLGRGGEEITTAVTNLDVHDLARTARTYGLKRYFVVTPVAEQQRLLRRLVEHWCSGFGAIYNPDRAEALKLVEIADSLEGVLESWEKQLGETPFPVLTGARREDGIDFTEARRLAAERPLLLVFGTGWGLAPGLFTRGWPVLEPVDAGSGYNHLPVRAAAAITLDRLMGLPSTGEVR